MHLIGAAEIDRVLDYPSLIEALREAFRAGATAPARHHHTLPRPAGDATLLLMPAWQEGVDGGYAGVKIVSVFPENHARGKPSVMGAYLLLAGDSGEPLAVLDGVALTLRRTAAASALAATYLAREDARRLTMIGAGALAPHLIAAHAAVRPIDSVTIWNRTEARAKRLSEDLAGKFATIAIVHDLDEAVGAADIVSAATMSREPLVHGESLSAGVHVDLVGAYSPAMREADDEAVRRASVFVDTRAGALKEAGDMVQPIASGVISEKDVVGDLFDLCRGKVSGRTSGDEITLFKSVGSAIEDLAAAVLVYQRRERSAVRG
jgi:alanine dehydrogenase